MIRTLTLLLLLSAPAWPGQTEEKIPLRFSMPGYFSCEEQSGWTAEIESGEKKYGVYQAVFTADYSGPLPVTVYVSYFTGKNRYFSGYGEYIQLNSRDDMAAETDKFSPVRKTRLAGRKTFVFDREEDQYLSADGSSDEKLRVKDKFYVLSAEEGFYVLHFSAPRTAYAGFLPAFERIAASFRPEK